MVESTNMAKNPSKQCPFKTTKTETRSALRTSIRKTPFGKTSGGNEVELFRCTNANGLTMKLTNYGAIVTSLEVPDREGRRVNVTLGFDSLEGYLHRHPYFGATVGRYCNRIAKGKFTLNGTEYVLARNEGPNQLHGGQVGFDKVVWNAEEVETDDAVGVKFAYRSKDGEEGYPGTLDITAVYALTNNNELVVEFIATTDKATTVNLTNHCYWNLAGAGAGSILEHELMIAADQVLAIDDTSIPTGELVDVKGGPFDFTTPKTIGADIEKLTAKTKGYDHCFALRGQGGKLSLAARVTEPSSGRIMEIFTTQPGVQFYTGNFLDGSDTDGGFRQHEGFCLETQHFPDSPNQPNFPSTILRPRETYHQETVHKFLVEQADSCR
jgi:aldose 1-epimerase